MKLLKRIFKIISTLIGLLVITVLIILGIDSYNTSYLKIKNNNYASNDSYLITNVNVVPMNQDTILVNKMVYIKDGIIEKIADNIDIKDVEIVDAKNKFITPGLIDMHVHVWDKYELGLYLSNGVTAVRNVWGTPMHLRLKKKINDDKLISPLFYTSGPKLTGPEFIGDDNLQLTNIEEAKAKIISYKERGYDFIKTYNGLTKELFDAILEQAKVSNIDVVSHPSKKVSFAYHFNPQIKSIEHAEDIYQQPLDYTLDTLKLAEVVNTYAKSNQGAFCPTLTVFNNIYQMLINDDILSSEQLQFMNPLIKKVDSKAQFDRWHNTKLRDSSIVTSIKNQHDFHLKIIKDFNDAGISIICGTDAGIGVTVPGYSIHKELAFYKEAGLTNYEAIKTATINASRTHTIMNNMGSIEVGKLANLLLVENNPLQDLSTLQKPLVVFIKGRQIKRSHLNSIEEKSKNRNNLIATAVRYAENLIIEK